MNKNIIIWVVLLAVVAGGAYLALSPSSPLAPKETTSPSPAGEKVTPGTLPVSGGTVQVDIKGFEFVSATTQVGIGTKIVWKNMDDVLHTVIGANFQSKPLKKGETFSHTFTQPGTYTYYDGLHPDAKGEIIVR